MRKKISIGVFIDVKKAFDTVNHDLLIDKLEYYGIRGIIIIIINFIYTLFPETKLCSRVFTTGTLIIQTKNIINDAKS